MKGASQRIRILQRFVADESAAWHHTVMDGFIPRRLTYEVDGETHTVADAQLLTEDVFQNRPLVLLGEAGSGKSRLLAERAGGALLVRASQLIADSSLVPAGTSLILVDALDEVAAQADGDAIDKLLAALRKTGGARFVLACRVADWRSETAKAAIEVWVGARPIELRIEPLSDTDAVRYLATNCALGDARAAEIVRHYDQRGLSEWLGNPQTLQMLGKVAQKAALPENAAALFEQFIDAAWNEHRKQSTPLADAAKGKVLDALGALFAALILGGHGAMTLAPAVKRDPGDLPFGELSTLPGLEQMPRDTLKAWLNSRLVAAPEVDRFTYQHRRIGEYLGARWLAQHANTDAKRHRLLGLFHSTGRIVPSNLRGLHAWLARHSDDLANDVVAGDPVGVIEYGDADHFNYTQARALLAGLERLAEENPRFRSWRSLRARSLVQPGLLPDIEAALSDPNRDFRLRLTLIEQVESAEATAKLQPTLVTLMEDPLTEFAIRDRAADALLKHGREIDWPRTISRLRAEDGEGGLRLALLIADEGKFAWISDTDLADLIFAYSAAAPRTVAKFWRVARDLPTERIDALLDALAGHAQAAFGERPNLDSYDLFDLAFELLLRRVDVAPLDPLRFWEWAHPFGEEGYSRDRRERLADWIRANHHVRRAIQRHVLLDAGGNETVRERVWRILDALPGGNTTPDDLVVLLESLPLGDARWRDLVELTPHRDDEGQAVREAARRHVANRPDMLAWLDELAERPAPEWERRQEKHELRRRAELAIRWHEHRADYHKHRDRMRRGDYGAIISPAQVYVGWVREGDKDTPPHRRIAEWLGEDLQAEAFAGFDAFLAEEPVKPSATEIATSYANSRRWDAGSIIVAALAERQRTARGFTDLSDERVTAGALEIELGLLREEPFAELANVLEGDLRSRGAYETFVRLMIEPALRSRSDHPTGLYSFAREEKNAPLARTLAAEWLAKFPRMAGPAEEELIDRLLRDEEFDTLGVISARRLRSRALDDRRRRNWQAIALITDFERASARFADLPAQQKDWLWTLRARIGGDRDHARKIDPEPALFTWIVHRFRSLWPNVDHPSGVTSGNKNAWDASDFLSHLIYEIAADTSDRAIAQLGTLRSVSDGYDDIIRTAIAEQAAKRADTDHLTIDVAQLAAVIEGGAPGSTKDLQIVVLEALDVVQAKVRGSDNDAWTRFYSDPAKLVPKGEEPCTDYLIDLLRQGDHCVTYSPEAHMPDGRETDVACTVGQFFVPIEAKGQWHRDLWKAADAQLTAQQAIDHRAGGRGVYLVYWFGKAGKALTPPPRGCGIEVPDAPEALEIALNRHFQAARSGLLAVKVLDLSRAEA
jgi:hypothetical protein